MDAATSESRFRIRHQLTVIRITSTAGRSDCRNSRWLQLDHDPILTSEPLDEAVHAGTVLRGLETGEPPCLLTPTDQCATERRDINPKDQLGRRSERVHQERSGDQRCHDGDASAIGPVMIIEHATHPADQLDETLAAVRGRIRVAQPGVEPGRVLGSDVDQCPASPCSEVTFTQVPDRFGRSSKTPRSRLACPPRVRVPKTRCDQSAAGSRPRAVRQTRRTPMFLLPTSGRGQPRATAEPSVDAGSPGAARGSHSRHERVDQNIDQAADQQDRGGVGEQRPPHASGLVQPHAGTIPSFETGGFASRMRPIGSLRLCWAPLVTQIRGSVPASGVWR